jgi:hypothetical protein
MCFLFHSVIYSYTPVAFLLPMSEKNNYSATVMICGGAKLSTHLASEACWSVTPDLGTPAAPATWKQLSNMPRGRLMPDTVLMPDGKVLMVNGARAGMAGGNAGQAQYAYGAWFETDMYDPATDTWTTVGRSQVARLYHSGAILLEDATVITTGSEMANYLDIYGTPEAELPPTPPLRPECYPYGRELCTDAYEYRVGK